AVAIPSVVPWPAVGLAIVLAEVVGLVALLIRWSAPVWKASLGSGRHTNLARAVSVAVGLAWILVQRAARGGRVLMQLAVTFLPLVALFLVAYLLRRRR